jgi:protein-S-isoprenylcysteine O-methyltransferase Ste14
VRGAIAMLEKLLPAWKGKLFVIVLLGFAATDFLITMTLSAADATEHLTENPLIPSTAQHHHVLITLVLLGLLGAIFLKGIREAIGIAVALVAAYFVLSAVVIAVGLWARRLASCRAERRSPSCGSRVLRRWRGCST